LSGGPQFGRQRAAKSRFRVERFVFAAGQTVVNPLRLADDGYGCPANASP
jgi:hypothetical protein